MAILLVWAQELASGWWPLVVTQQMTSGGHLRFAHAVVFTHARFAHASWYLCLLPSHNVQYKRNIDSPSTCSANLHFSSKDPSRLLLCMTGFCSHGPTPAKVGIHEMWALVAYPKPIGLGREILGLVNSVVKLPPISKGPKLQPWTPRAL